jgi:arylsulfatase A
LQVDSSWWQSYFSSGLAEREARIYGMIEQLDHEIGRILDALATSNKLDNTMIIFMSDNGPINGWRVPQEEMRFNAGLRDQKFTTYEGGIRTQCYWRWEKHWTPGLRNQVAAHIDILPTIMDLLGIKPSTTDPSIDGISLRGTLEGATDSREDNRVIFQKYALETLRNPAPFPGGVAIKGPWKMVNGEALYHLEQDVGETINLATSEPEIFEQLKKAYLKWYQDISDDRDLASVDITVGHAQENPVYLQPHHATASGHVKFWGNRGLIGQRRGTHPNGVDSDWSGEWQAKSDALEWEVNMVQSGNYSFQVMARDTTSGSVEQLSMHINDEPLLGSPLLYKMSHEWMPYELGMVHLDQGRNRLKLVLEDDLSAALEIQTLVVKKE